MEASRYWIFPLFNGNFSLSFDLQFFDYNWSWMFFYFLHLLSVDHIFFLFSCLFRTFTQFLLVCPSILLLLLLLLISKILWCPFWILCDIVFRFLFASHLSFTIQWFLFLKLWESNPDHLDIFRPAQKGCKRAYKYVLSTKIRSWINFLKKKKLQPLHSLEVSHGCGCMLSCGTLQHQQCWGNMGHVLRSTGIPSTNSREQFFLWGLMRLYPKWTLSSTAA